MKLRTVFAVLACAAAVGACKQGSAPPAADNTATPVAPAADPPAPPPGFKEATGTQEATPENVAASKDRMREGAKSARATWRDKTFEEFKASVYKEPFEDGKYVVSGDIAIADEKQLRELFEEQIRKEGDAGDERLIVVAGPNGTWNSQRKKRLTYCVSRAFGPRHARVVAEMQSAAGAWQQVADVRFEHVAAQDAACTAANPQVVFDVRPVNQGGYLARAFFPNEPRSARNVLVDESAFRVNPSGNLQLVGILRHELGHTLGWRHEHTRPESGTCFEDADWVPMTGYDDLSVMHYPQCNGAGDWKLQLTAMDKSGAACVYGPASGFTIDQTLVQGNCVSPVTPPAAPGTAQTRTFSAQNVALERSQRYGPFNARPGTVIAVSLTGARANPGDADLYVALASDPTRRRGEYDCRPYLSSSNETCEITARDAPRNRAHVMVYGYSRAKYDLKVTYFPE